MQRAVFYTIVLIQLQQLCKRRSSSWVTGVPPVLKRTPTGATGRKHGICARAAQTSHSLTDGTEEAASLYRPRMFRIISSLRSWQARPRVQFAPQRVLQSPHVLEVFFNSDCRPHEEQTGVPLKQGDRQRLCHRRQIRQAGREELDTPRYLPVAALFATLPLPQLCHQLRDLVPRDLHVRVQYTSRNLLMVRLTQLMVRLTSRPL